MLNWPAPSRLALLLVVLFLLLAGAWLWQASLQQDTHSRYASQRDTQHAELLQQALVPALANRDQNRVRQLIEPALQPDSIRHIGVYDPAGTRIATLGSPPVLRQPVDESMQTLTGTRNDWREIEQPVYFNDRLIGALQLGYAAPSAGLAALLLAHWPLLGLSLLAAVLASALAVLMLRPLQRDLDQLEQQLSSVLQNPNESLPVQANTMQLITERINRILDLLRQDKAQMLKRLNQQQRLNQNHTRVLQSLDIVVWETTSGNERIERISGPVERLFGHPESAWQTPDFLSQHFHPRDYHWLREQLLHPIASTEATRFELRLRDGEGHWRWAQLGLVTARQGDTLQIIGAMQDVTEAKRNQRQVIELAQQDSLTGIGNRVWFLQQLTEQLEQAQRNRTPGALFFLDLDRFDFVNSVFGQAVGDAFLKRLAYYLGELFSESGQIARLGGDEFGVILPDTSAEQATEYVNQLLSTLQRLHFTHETSHVPFSSSVGIALFPEHGEQADKLLTRAAVALQQAKGRGRGTYQLVSGVKDDSEETGDTAAWERRLRDAVDYDQFTLFFQPIIDLDVGIIHYYECLLRLVEPSGRTYGPGLFINAAEHLGLRDTIERRALIKAIRAQGVGNRSGSPVSLTINLSNRQLNQADLVEQIRTAVKEHNAEPRRIVFEVNAKSAANNMLRTRQIVNELRKDGFRFAWDDFGVGALSFEDLRAVPFDYIKIDGELTTKVVWSPADRAMVKAIADLAQGLNMALMAESVETEHMLRILRTDHVAFGQGRLFAEPAPRFHAHERIIVSELERETS